MSVKHPTHQEKEIIKLHLKGQMEFKAAAQILEKTDVAFAFLIVGYARWAMKRAEEIKNADQ